MNNIEQLVHNICQVWVDCDQAALEKYYAKSIEADYYGQKVTFQDMLDRLHYMREHQSERKLTVLEIVQQNNKAAIRFHYHAIDSKDGLINTDLAGFYEFNEQNQVVKAWAFASQAVDYRTE